MLSGATVMLIAYYGETTFSPSITAGSGHGGAVVMQNRAVQWLGS